jgi:propionyl-CoA synthetase
MCAAENTLRCFVLDHWWQTESGWAICANAVGLEGYVPVKYGSTSKPCPGFDVQVLDSENHTVARNVTGKLAIKLPLPPGAMLCLYNSEERFFASYLAAIPGYYDTGDTGYIDEDGYVFVMSRSDDVLNVAGHRLSSGAFEEVIAEHGDVAEVAVVGLQDAFKGQIPLALLVLNNAMKDKHEDIKREVIQMVSTACTLPACWQH